MTLIVKDTSESKFPKLPLPEAGTTHAVCCAVWDLGEQKSFFKNDDGTDKYQHKIMIAWEITEKINLPESEYNGKPYMMTKEYTFSLAEKANLRKDLEAWRGAAFTEDEIKNGFDLDNLYGVNCFIGIAHEPSKKDATKIYANVNAILKLPKGIEKITPLRTREEPPPKWVTEKANIKEAMPPMPEPSDDFPFGEPVI